MLAHADTIIMSTSALYCNVKDTVLHSSTQRFIQAHRSSYCQHFTKKIKYGIAIDKISQFLIIKFLSVDYKNVLVHF